MGVFKKSPAKPAPRTLGKSLARELTTSEQEIVAGGACHLTYPPVTGYTCDPHEH